MNGWKRALVLAPHTDDGEFGCGGTIARLVASNCRVHYLAFSVPEPADDLFAEVTEATALLGATLNVRWFPARRFHEHRQEILDVLLGERARAEPDVVFCPSACDVHQDHVVVAEEAQRAFKHTTLLGYELPWNNYRFAYQAFIKLSEQEVDRKVAAISRYRSQAGRRYADPDYIRAVVRAHGVQAGAAFAEAFEVYRLTA